MKTIEFVLEWVWKSSPQIAATMSVLVAMLRAIPPKEWTQIEHDWPRLANLARVLRAIFPDVVKALRAVIAIWRGKQWSQ